MLIFTPNPLSHLRLHKQRGAVLMVMLVILIIGATAMLVSSLNSATLLSTRNSNTSMALAQAKMALIGYSAAGNTPGQLLCPENTALIGTSTEGSASGSCTLPAIGRLPWRTLGIGPLRDGNGDLLWYAVSPGFRNSPINSDIPAQLTIDGVSSSAVAIIFSPGPPINGQSRPIPTSAIPPDVTQYLDLSNNDGDNTFVTSGSVNTFNDQLLPVTHDDLFHLVEKRVTKEVVNALNEYFCGAGNINPAGGCLAAGGNRYYPRPADFTDTSCLGNGLISTMPMMNSCPSSGTNRGRIPAHPATDWSPTSILNGANSSSWFQTNSWREVIFYAVATACTNGTSNCNGTGYLTLNNSTPPPLTNQKVVVIATGNALSTTTPAQVRTNNVDKTSINNYLEDENLSPLDDVYTKSAALPFNDIAISIP